MPTAIELAESRNEAWSDGKITAMRRFAVYDDSSALTTAAAVRALFGTTVGSTVLPDIGSQFPGDTSLYAKSYSLKCEPSSNYTWTVEFSYENSEPLEKQPQEIGYTQFSVDWSVEFREFYRVNPGLQIPQYGSPGGSYAETTGGVAIDVAGEPLTTLHYLGAIEFTETVSLATLPDRSQLIRAARGKRNLTEFQGAPIGQVLYKGARANRIGVDRVSLTHTFAQDGLYHMLQVAQKDADGKPTVVTFPDGTTQAAYVKWVQPFPEFANFNLLSENF